MKQQRKVLILMVEDDKNNHQLYREVFERDGFEVILLENADGPFVEKVSSTMPDIISMDLMLGDASIKTTGFDAIKELKADIRTAKIPVMVMSNFFEESKVQLAKEVGAVDYINLAGESISNIPKQFLKYLEEPKNYKHSHPLFKDKSLNKWQQFFTN